MHGIETDRDRTSDLVDTLADACGIESTDESGGNMSMHDDDASQINPKEDNVGDFVLNEDPFQECEDVTLTHDDGTTNDA